MGVEILILLARGLVMAAGAGLGRWAYQRPEVQDAIQKVGRRAQPRRRPTENS